MIYQIHPIIMISLELMMEIKNFIEVGQNRRPCGWKRYALKVHGKFGNDALIGSNGKSNVDSEWALSYHGKRQEFVEPIYNKGYKIDPRNKYGNGVYCTPNSDTAVLYAKEYPINGKRYKVVLQNR